MRKKIKLKIMAMGVLSFFASQRLLAQWNLTGNATITTDFFGTTNNQPIKFYSNNVQNASLLTNGDFDITNPTSNGFSLGGYQVLSDHNNASNIFVGFKAGKSQAGGLAYNTFVGDSSGYNTNGNILSSVNGIYNTFTGGSAGYKNTGNCNNAFGFFALYRNTTGYANVGIGLYAGSTGTTGSGNVAIGDSASLLNSTGSFNTAAGYKALYSNTTGNNNAFGYYSLYNNTSGADNSVFGYNAGKYNQTGSDNAIFGYDAGGANAGAVNSFSNNSFYGSEAAYNMKVQSDNVAMGYQALYTQNYSSAFNSDNVAIGYQALYTNNPTSTTNGYLNNALGFQAGYSNTIGLRNNFFGYQAGYLNATGNYDYYLGTFSGYHNTQGSYNVCVGDNSGNGGTGATYNACVYIGQQAGQQATTGDSNTFVGYAAGYSGTTGKYNVGLGLNSGKTITTGSKNTCVGTGADVSSSISINRGAFGYNAVNNQGDNTIYFGNSAITGLWCTLGQITTSDSRFKYNVKEDVKGLAFINKLRPVTYQLNTSQIEDFRIQNMSDSVKALHKNGIDFKPSSAMIHAGFLAQEVESAANQCGFNSSIVSVPADPNKSTYGLNYSELVVPLVKAIQELSHKVDSLLGVTQTGQRTNQNNNGGSGNNKGTVGSINIELSDVNAIVLNQNAPNPFAEQTVITYNIPEKTNAAQILFYNNNGMLIKTVDIKTSGKGQLNVYANDLSSGTYSYTLLIDGKIYDTKKMMKQ